MSGPGSYYGSRQQPPPSASALRERAEQAASDAEIATVLEGDASRTQLAANYGAVASATLTSANELPAEVRAQLAAHLDRVRALTTAGESLRRAIPTPRLSGELAKNPYASQHTYDLATAAAVLANAEQMVATAQNGLDTEAEAITRAAWLAAVPAQPDRAMAGRVEAGVAAVHAAISAGQKPSDILQRAIAAGDDTLVYALLGHEQSKTLLTALGVDRAALAKTYGQQVLASGRSFPGAAFLAAQQDPARSLAAVRSQALAVYEAQKARAGAILRTRAATRGGSR